MIEFLIVFIVLLWLRRALALLALLALIVAAVQGS